MDFNAKQSSHVRKQHSTTRYPLQLCLYDPQHLDDLLHFHLPEEQHRFTALPAEVLSVSLSDPERHPVVMVADGQAVGFFVLHEGNGITTYKSYTDTPPHQLMLLRALLINQQQQGLGYGKQAMRQLGVFVQHYFSHIREVILAVNEQNEPAHGLYIASGFEDHGMRRQGAIGMQRILHYYI